MIPPDQVDPRYHCLRRPADVGGWETRCAATEEMRFLLLHPGLRAVRSRRGGLPLPSLRRPRPTLGCSFLFLFVHQIFALLAGGPSAAGGKGLVLPLQLSPGSRRPQGITPLHAGTSGAVTEAGRWPV